MGRGLGFRVAGIPVTIDPTFLLVAVMLGLGVRTGGLLVSWVVIVVGSVLLHELGHAFAFRRYGKEPSILLQGMGGLTSAAGELTPARDVVVSLSGPLTGLVLLGLPALYLRQTAHNLSPNWHAVLSDVVFVNLAWSVLNLLPVLPLDGGRVSAALWSLGTKGQGMRQAHLLSAVVAGAGAAYAFASGYLFAALFGGFFCAYNVSRLSAGRNQNLQQQVVGGWHALQADRPDPAAAAAAAEAVLRDRPSALVMTQAQELLAWSRLAAADGAGARHAIERVASGYQIDPFLLAALDLDAGNRTDAVDRLAAGYAIGRFGPGTARAADAAARAELDRAVADRLLAPGGPGPDALAQFAVHLHAAGRYRQSIEAGTRALEGGAQNPGRVAYNLACSEARAGDPDAAAGWLERATTAGFADAALLETDPDLSSLRGTARFRALQERLRTAT